MDRTPEPELMTDEAQAKAYAEADFEVPHNHFVTLLHEHLGDLPSRGVALDLGCGPADVTIRVARSLPEWTFVGVDGSDAMLDYGHTLIARHDGEDAAPSPLKDRISLVKAYLPLDSVGGGPFALVFSNSLLHHLADPAVLWTSIAKFVPPKTPCFVMDLMRPASAASAEEMVETYSKDEPEVLKRDFLYSLHAAYTTDEVASQVAAAGLQGLNVKAVSDRHLVVFGLT